LAETQRTPQRAPAPARNEPERNGWRLEGAPKPEQTPPRFRPPGGRRFWWILLALLVLNWIVVSQIPRRATRLEVPYTTFRHEVEAKNVAEVTSRGDVIQGTFKKDVTYPPPAAGEEPNRNDTNTKFETTRPAFADDSIFNLLEKNGVIVNAQPLDQGRSTLLQILLFFGPTLLLIGLFVLLARRAGATGGLMGFGRSRAKRYEASAQRTTFEDVAGIEEAEEELVEVVDFLKNPDKYVRLGGKIPRASSFPARPGLVRRSSPGPSPARRTPRSSRSQPRSSSR
jgi:cell division protease FtsH